MTSRHRAAASPARPAFSAAPDSATRSHLLVVGDADIAALCASGTRDGRFAVDHLPTLEDALPRLPAVRSGILITELDLPDGDGADLCRAVKTRWHPGIVLVATRDVSRVPKALAAGCDSVLLKPFAPNLLFARLGRLTRDLQRRLANPAVRAGTHQQWPAVHCPNCGRAGATAFDATSLRRAWFACLACENVWIAGPSFARERSRRTPAAGAALRS